MAREIRQDMTLGQIASTFPELIPELERLNTDYCCGGGRTLAAAAAEMGRDSASLVRHLSSVEPIGTEQDAVDYTKLSMTELSDHIEQTHHADARKALERLDHLLAKCVAAHADDEPRLCELQQTVASMTEDMHDHFVREERVLFPWFRRLERKTEIQGGPPWSVRRPVDCMIHDHDDLGETFRRIHDLSDDLTAPEGACSTWIECYRVLADLERDTHVHIHKENNILFPAGIEAERRLGSNSGFRRRAVPGSRSASL